MAIRIKAATSLSVILLIAFTLELLAVLSVPVTSKISLSTFQDYKFGVFGYCNTKTNTCTKVGLGYNIPDGDNKFRLPSSARRSLSNLLIVHVVAAGLTFILFICAVLCHIHGPGSSQKYLLCLILLALPSFLISLLAFLVDILLFVSHMDWGGWIMLAATVLTALSGIILCLMRRTLSSQKAMKRRNRNTNSELQDFSFSPTKFQDDLPVGRNYSEIKFQPATVEDSIPLNQGRLGSNNGTGDIGDFSFNSAVTDSSSYIHQERTPSPSREFRHANNGFSYRGGYVKAGDGPSNQLEYNNNIVGTITPTRSQVPHVIPAGTYITGENDNENRNNEDFAQNVIPLPRIRQVQHQQPRVEHFENGVNSDSNSNYSQTNQNNEYSRAVPTGQVGVPAMGNVEHTQPPQTSTPGSIPGSVPGTTPTPTPSSNLPIMNRRPSGPRMLPEGTSAIIDNEPAPYIAPRQLWAQQQAQQQHSQPPSQGPTPQYQEQQSQQQYQPPPQQPYQQPPTSAPQHGRRRSSASKSYRQFFVEDEQAQGYIDNEPLQLPGTGDDVYHGPSSPATSDTSSNYTSISQRPVNPRYYQPQRGPDRSEFVLQNNPDFNLGLPTSSRKKNVGGPRGPRGPSKGPRPPAASQTSDGPYGITNH